MEKTYIVITAKDNKYSMQSYSDFVGAWSGVNRMTDKQEGNDGMLEREYFGSRCEDKIAKQRTTLIPFFGEVLYGIEATNCRGEKTYRVVYELDVL